VVKRLHIRSIYVGHIDSVPCGIRPLNGSMYLHPRSQIHGDDPDEVVLVAEQWRRQKPRCVCGLVN
jgi:hypothetical protein